MPSKTQDTSHGQLIHSKLPYLQRTTLYNNRQPRLEPLLPVRWPHVWVWKDTSNRQMYHCKVIYTYTIFFTPTSFHTTTFYVLCSISTPSYSVWKIKVCKQYYLQNITSNDPEEDINECNKCNRVIDELDPLIEQKLTPKGPRTSSRQKKPPTTKNNDFLW